MDERVRQTVETYENVADTYETIHGDRSVIAELVEMFLSAVPESRDAVPVSRDAVPVSRDAVPESRDAVPESRDASDRARVLDVGPGPGWESAAFADHGFDVVALDLTRSFLEQTCERAPGVGVVNGDMRSLPLVADSFDGLWACASLLHVPKADVTGTLSEFERVLAPGGVAVVSLQREREGYDSSGDGAEDQSSPYDDDYRHFELYDPSEIRAAFEAAGFADVEVEADDTGEWFSIVAHANGRTTRP